MRYGPEQLPNEWRDLLLLVPGYDPIATAPYGCWFDSDEAALRIGFFPDLLKHIEGDMAGKPFALEPWQKAFLANLFGWKCEDSKGREVRRYREALLYVPRKNGKTPLVAGLAVEELTISQERGQQDYIAAGEREQAGMLFRHCRGMVEQEPELKKQFSIYGGGGTAGQSRSIVRNDDQSFLRVVSADADTKHGGNSHLAIIDELHVQPNRDLVDVLRTSTASENRKQPLLIFITTADYDRPSICNEIHDYACKVRDGIIDDPAFLPVIYEAPREADWREESVWRAANPNLGVSVSLAYLRGECKRAQEVPAYENTFRRLHLNQKTSTAEKCISLEQWDAGRQEIDWHLFAGRECYAGFDIGAMSDFTALLLLFPHDDAEPVEVKDGEESKTITRRSYTMRPYFWLPERPRKRDSRMQAQIDAWIKMGLIRVTSGDAVDYAQVLEDICEIDGENYIAGLGFDRGFQGMQIGNNLVARLGEDRVHYITQGIVSLNAPFREFLELLAAGRIYHDGNPVLRWMASNTMAESRGGLIKPSKDMSSEKIDGISAATMAIRVGSVSVGSWYVPGSGL